MDRRNKKKFEVVYDNLYDLKNKLNNLFSSKASLFLDDLEKEAKEWGYEFKLNDKQQKFKLYKIK